MPENAGEAENYRTVLLDLTKTFKKLQTDFNQTLENAIKLWGA